VWALENPAAQGVMRCGFRLGTRSQSKSEGPRTGCDWPSPGAYLLLTLQVVDIRVRK
jgi:hypothetical protein